MKLQIRKYKHHQQEITMDIICPSYNPEGFKRILLLVQILQHTKGINGRQNSTDNKARNDA